MTCIGVTLLLWPAILSATEERTVVIDACASDALDAYGRELAAKLTPTPATPRVQPNAPSCTFDDGPKRRAVLESGRAAFEALDIDRAVQLLRTLLADIEAEPRLERDFEMSLEARLYLGWIALERHDTAAARNYFTAVCASAPTWTPSHVQFPPNVTKEWKRTCVDVKPAATVRLDQSATLRVDEQGSCSGPCELHIAAGGHFIVVDDGKLRRDLFVDAKADETTTIDVSLAPTAAEQLRAAVDAGDAAALAPGMATSGADNVVILDSVSDGVIAALAIRPFRTVTAPLALGTDVDDAATHVSLELERLHSLAAAEPKPLWSKWWFWTGVGVVTAGATVGIVAAARHQRHLAVGATLP